MKYLHTIFGKTEIANYDEKYASWNYKKAAPVKIIRLYLIPYVSIPSDIVEYGKSISDPSIFDMF